MIDRDWIHEFEPRRGEERELLREIVIQERGGNYFDVFLTHPDRRLMVQLTLDEVLGYVALALVNGRPARWWTLDERRAWEKRYAPPPPLEPWQKRLVENCPR